MLRDVMQQVLGDGEGVGEHRHAAGSASGMHHLIGRRAAVDDDRLAIARTEPAATLAMARLAGDVAWSR
ncbi:MAG: hypothetical protein V9G20_29890 [Candidatus Promineifilaceae bacterium]